MIKFIIILVLGCAIGCCSVKLARNPYPAISASVTTTVRDVLLLASYYNSTTTYTNQITVFNTTSNSFEFKNYSASPVFLQSVSQGDLVYVTNLISISTSNLEIYNATSDELRLQLGPVQRLIQVPSPDKTLFASWNVTTSNWERFYFYNLTTNELSISSISFPYKPYVPILLKDTVYFYLGNGTYVTYDPYGKVQGQYSTKFVPLSYQQLATTDLFFSFYLYTNTSTNQNASMIEIFNFTSGDKNYITINSDVISTVWNTLYYKNKIFVSTFSSGINYLVVADIITKAYSVTALSATAVFDFYNSTVWKFTAYDVQFFVEATSTWSTLALPFHAFNTHLFVNDTLAFASLIGTSAFVPEIHFYNLANKTWSFVNTNYITVAQSAISINDRTGVIYGGFTHNGTALIPYCDAVFTITRCFSDVECDDLLFCNGQEYCNNGFCSSSDPPCNQTTCLTCNEEADNCLSPVGSDCDNNNYCDGIDTCDGNGKCVHSGNPCPICQNCEEASQSCYNTTKGTSCPGNGTCSIFVCDGFGVCSGFELSTCVEKTEGNTKNNSTFLAIIFGSILGALLLIFVTVIAIYFLMKRRKSSSSFENRSSIEMSLAVIDNVKKLERIGSGEFGDVYRGYLDDTIEVALKTLKPTDYANNDFQREIGLLKSLNHPNIVRLYGLHKSADNERFMVLEYMSKGSLLQLLHNSNKSITLHVLLQMAKQIVAGMKYLEANNVIHRDLALRNILASVDERENYTVKVSDFGMSRVLQQNYYKTEDKKMPIKWSAPEVSATKARINIQFIQYGKSTSKSDVWSFGICLWELFSYGMVPYMSWSNDVVIEKVLEGYRMPPPSNCPKQLYSIMNECWNQDPEKRPSFLQLSQKISTIVIEQTESKGMVESNVVAKALHTNSGLVYNS